MQPQPQGHEPQIYTDVTQMARHGKLAVYPHKDLTERIIGAAMEVHNQLGPGFLERVYENAMLVELRARGLSAVAQIMVPVSYKGVLVGDYLADLMVEGVLCELKAVSGLAKEHEAQIINYLKGTGIKIGLLLNFGSSRLQISRFIY